MKKTKQQQQKDMCSSFLFSISLFLAAAKIFSLLSLLIFSEIPIKLFLNFLEGKKYMNFIVITKLQATQGV